MPDTDSIHAKSTEQPPRSRAFDVTNYRSHRLVALRPIGKGHNGIIWECRCDCGNIARVAATHLRDGSVKSCGCARIGVNVRHGGTNTRLYTIWWLMLDRCRNPKRKEYPNYGGRGIRVCERWQSFENFRADMGEPPSTRHTLDRIENEGNYESGNCRWATRKQQQRNRRGNHLVTALRQTKTVSEWAESTGLKITTLAGRLRDGWSPEDAVTLPPSKRKYRNRKSD